MPMESRTSVVSSPCRTSSFSVSCCWAISSEAERTHTGQGGPPPTGKRTSSDYVYSMDFDGDKIRHMTKIWNAGWAMKELGWA